MAYKPYAIERLGISNEELSADQRGLERKVEGLLLECQAQWAEGKPINGSVWASFRDRKPWFNYPRDLPLFLSGTPEVRYLLARRQLKVLEAGLLLSDADHVILTFHRVPFAIDEVFVRAHFWDSLAKSHARVVEYDEMLLPETGAAARAFVQPGAWLKEAKAKDAECWSPSADGPVWKQTADKPEENVTAKLKDRELEIGRLLEILAARQRSEMPQDPILNEKLAALLDENERYRRRVHVSEERGKELSEDYKRYGRRLQAAKELGM